jgi:hypothetical protein
MGRVPAARVVAAGAGRAAPIVGRVGQLAFQALELLAGADWMCSRLAARPKCNSSVSVTKKRS